MFNRIRNWWEQRLVKKAAKKTISTLTLSTAPSTPIFQILPAGSDNALIFTGSNGDDIFSISADGEAKWLKEDSYNEAAEMFLSYMTMHIEDSAGIMQNRIEWENRIATALVSEAKDAPLGPEELTDVLRKCIMYDKLKGIKN
jgi:hypothetical protein